MNATPISEPSGGRFTPAVFSAISHPKRSAKVHGWLGGHLQERSMCDYSLHAVATRPAEVAETLVSTKFKSTTTRGLRARAIRRLRSAFVQEPSSHSRMTFKPAVSCFGRKSAIGWARFRQIAFDQ